MSKEWTISITSPEGIGEDLIIDESVVSLAAVGEDKYLKEQFSRILHDIQVMRKRAKMRSVS